VCSCHLLLREEGQEVKGYLELYRETPAGQARDTALTLAKESAEHAGTLGGLVGAVGEPWHRTASGGFVRSVVYGFNDGLTANFGLVAGVIGASVAPHVILVSGVAGMIADALSMGSSGYLAAKSEREVYDHEIAMEREEIRLMPEVEEEELALLYEAKGVQREQARRMAKDVMKDEGRALNERCARSWASAMHGPRHSRKAGYRHGHDGRRADSGGAVPGAERCAAIWTSFTLAMVSHFAVGAARSFFTGRGIIRSGIDMFVVGMGVAGVGYLVGEAVARWV